MANDLVKLKGYMKSVMAERGLGKAAPMKTVPFITISREAGAGGHSLAEAILREMESRKGDPTLSGWQMFDEKICTRLLNDPKLSVSFQSLLTEEYHGQVSDYIYQLVAGATPQYVVYRKIFKMIRTLALCGKAILVGRGAVCYTRDIPGGVHLRLVAPEAARLRTLQERFNLSEEKARRMAQEQDEARRRLLRDFFRKDIDVAQLYDAVWNTHTVPIPTIARLVTDLVQERATAAPEELAPLPR